MIVIFVEFIDELIDYPINRASLTISPAYTQRQLIDQCCQCFILLLYFQTGGFFVECGGFDGEQSSNSLLFEKDRNWTGLLIEADPGLYKTLKTKNRKAFTVNACLNTEPYPAVVRTYGSRKAERCFRTCAKCTDSDLPEHAQSLIRAFVFNTFCSVQ